MINLSRAECEFLDAAITVFCNGVNEPDQDLVNRVSDKIARERERLDRRVRRGKK